MNILFRTDANVAMGTGHVMRCLALAQSAADCGGMAVFAMAQTTPAVERRLRSEDAELVRIGAASAEADAERTVEAAQRCSAGWMVIDGYQFGSSYQQALHDSGVKTLLLDDLGGMESYSADLILNQNPHACPGLYTGARGDAGLLLGSRFALLRREFKPWRAWVRAIPEQGRKVLISMGGSDPARLTETAISAFSLLNDAAAEAAVVLGGSNPDSSAMPSTVDACGGRVAVHRDARNMAELIAWADVAISAAGSTCYEFCLLGLPALVIDVAANQKPVASELSKRGVARHIGSEGRVSAERMAKPLAELLAAREERATMARLGQELVDGCGAERVLAAMRRAGLRLRKVTPADCAAVWNLANEAGARANSFSTTPIPWEDHRNWFAGKLRDPNSCMFLAFNGLPAPIGLIRYQIEGERAVVSVNVAREFRHQGYGKSLLARGAEEMFRDGRVAAVHAYVKAGNTASANLFAHAGFVRQPHSGPDSGRIHFVMERSAAHE